MGQDASPPGIASWALMGLLIFRVLRRLTSIKLQSSGSEPTSKDTPVAKE